MMRKFDTIHVFNLNDDNAWTLDPFRKNKGKRKVRKLKQRNPNKSTRKFLRSWQSLMKRKLNTRPIWMLLIFRTTWKH